MAQTSSTTLFLGGAEVISVERQHLKPILTPLSVSAQQRPKSLQPHYRLQIVWRNVIAFIILHSIAAYSIYSFFKSAPTISTFVFFILLSYFGAVGITAGAHRLWAHRCYKAKWQLRLILMVFQSVAFQNHIYEWVRDHRVHHKFTDTDADPHNSKRGFFFSHMGWLMLRKHPDVFSKGKTVDMSDLEKDSIVMWQKKYYPPLVIIATFVLPTFIPYYCWGETFKTSFLFSVLRYVLSLNFTWLVNSAAHIWGMKPYDKTISATENTGVALLTFGEGFHNYHHAFPWDYKAAELGNYKLNLSTAFIDFFAKLGWAYDLKVATKEIIASRIKRTGDGTHSPKEDIWGWDDIDMTNEDKKLVKILNVKKME